MLSYEKNRYDDYFTKNTNQKNGNCVFTCIFRCNTFTFLTASTLLYKSVRGAFRNVGRK